MDTHSVYPSSLHYSVPDADHSKRSSANTLLANINGDFIWTEKRSQIDSNVDFTSSKQHALRFVTPYPVSSGTASSKSAIWINVRVNSSFTPQRFDPNNHGRTDGSSNLDHYKGHVPYMNPLPYSQTNGNQHGGRIEGLSKNGMKINEGGPIKRAVWLHVNPSENMPSSQLTPVISNAAENLRAVGVSSKSVLQPHFQLPQRPLFQQPWRSHADVQAMNEAHSGISKSDQRQQVLYEEGAALQGDQTANYEPANSFRVKAGYASEILPPFFHTTANIYNQENRGHDQFQDIHRTSQSGPFATHLPTSNSATNRGAFSYLHFPSTANSVVQSQKTLELSQSKPNIVSSASQSEDKTVYSTSVSQPAWRFLDTSKTEGDVATFFGNSPVAPSLSDYSSQPKLIDPENIPNSQNTRTAQWLVIKPYPALNSAREAVNDRVYPSSSTQSIFDRSQIKQNRDFRDFGLSSQAQAPQTTELRSNMQMIPSVVPDVMQHVIQGTGSVHGDLSSKVKPSLVLPFSSSRRTFTGYQTSRSGNLNMRESMEWKPQALPSSFNKEDWSATVPLAEGTSGKQSYPQTNPTQYNIKVLANLNIKGSKDLGYMNKSIFFRPRTLQDLLMTEQIETSAKGTITDSDSQSERSYGLSTNLDSLQNTDVPPVGESDLLANGSDQSIGNYLSINSSQVSKLTATDTGKTPGQGLSAVSGNENAFNEPISVFSEVNSSSPEDATDGGHTLTDYLYSLNESKSVNESLYVNSGPQTVSEDKNASALESVPASLKTSTAQERTEHEQAKTLTDLEEALYLNQGEVKPEKENQTENEEQAKTEQPSSHDNAKRNSRPTSTVAVGKRIKVKSRNKSTASQNAYESMQPPIYRSPIVRRKSKSRLLANISVELSKEGTKPENQSVRLTTLTESPPVNVEGDHSFSNLLMIPIRSNNPVNNPEHDSDGQQSLNGASSQSLIKQIKPKPIRFSDVAGSASISIFKPAHIGPLLNGIEQHSNFYSLSESPLGPTTTEPVSAAAGDDEEEEEVEEEDFQPTSTSVATYAVEDGLERSPINVHSIP